MSCGANILSPAARGGVYQWERIEEAKAFYTAPRREEARLSCSRRPLPPNLSEKISLIFCTSLDFHGDGFR